MDKAISKNKVPIRLTNERWQHISTGHPEIVDYYYEILETLEDPAIIYQGEFDALIAVSKEIEPVNKFIVVVYKESSLEDGYIITAYVSNKEQKFKKKKVLWIK